MILETPTAGEQRWLVTLTLSLVACLIAVAWVTRQPFCVDSEVLRRLEWRGKEASFDLHRCRARHHVSYRTEIAEQLPALNRRLVRLENQGEFYFGHVWKNQNLVLRVVPALPAKKMQTLEDPVFVTPDELHQSGILESRVLAKVLRQNLVHSDGPSAHLLESFFLDMTGYIDGEETPAAVMEKSDWKLALYSESVRRSRALLPMGEQRRIFEEWRALLNQEKTAAWALPAAVQSLMHESLAAFGYRQDLRLFQLPFAVMWPDKNVNLSRDQVSKIHRLMSAVILEDEIQFPFSNFRFSRVNSAPVQVGRLILFQCGLPRLDEMENLGVEFEHVLFIQSCETPNVELVVAALRSPRSFAIDYPEVDFAQIHWPSLVLALKKSGVTETTLAGLFRTESLQSFRKVGFLSSIDQDPVTGIRSWKGPLEPFPMFRLTTKN